jgi:hypothetical protein
MDWMVMLPDDLKWEYFTGWNIVAGVPAGTSPKTYHVGSRIPFIRGRYTADSVQQIPV